jgi:hypothetical protein
MSPVRRARAMNKNARVPSAHDIASDMMEAIISRDAIAGSLFATCTRHSKVRYTTEKTIPCRPQHSCSSTRRYLGPSLLSLTEMQPKRTKARERRRELGRSKAPIASPWRSDSTIRQQHRMAPNR